MRFLYTEHEGGGWLRYDNPGIDGVEQLERMLENEDNWDIVDDAPLHMSFFRTRIGTVDMHAIWVGEERHPNVWDSSLRMWRETLGDFEEMWDRCA